MRPARSVLAADADIVAKRAPGCTNDDACGNIAIKCCCADPARRTADGRAFKIGCNAARQDESGRDKRGEKGGLGFCAHFVSASFVKPRDTKDNQNFVTPIGKAVAGRKVCEKSGRPKRAADRVEGEGVIVTSPSPVAALRADADNETLPHPTALGEGILFAAATCAPNRPAMMSPGKIMPIPSSNSRCRRRPRGMRRARVSRR